MSHLSATHARKEGTIPPYFFHLDINSGGSCLDREVCLKRMLSNAVILRSAEQKRREEKSRVEKSKDKPRYTSTSKCNLPESCG